MSAQASNGHGALANFHKNLRFGWNSSSVGFDSSNSFKSRQPTLHMPHIAAPKAIPRGEGGHAEGWLSLGVKMNSCTY
jgi:hypothetical protein